MHPVKRIAIAAAIAAVHLAAAAQASPVGLWKTVDDDGTTEKSLVRITEAGGALTGRIEKLLDPATAPDAVCGQCTDDRRGQPLVGLEILRGLKRGEGEWWEGGEVTDPKNGKSYRARLRTVEQGQRLQVRGHIGPFYRTQTWTRVE
jgi:uncharacterized protein (DUF2147 family)